KTWEDCILLDAARRGQHIGSERIAIRIEPLLVDLVVQADYEDEPSHQLASLHCPDLAGLGECVRAAAQGVRIDLVVQADGKDFAPAKAHGNGLDKAGGGGGVAAGGVPVDVERLHV